MCDARKRQIYLASDVLLTGHTFISLPCRLIALAFACAIGITFLVLGCALKEFK